MARRRDPDPLAALEQVQDQPRALPRLPGAGRPLDEEVPPLDAIDELLHLVELGDLHALAVERRLAPQDALERRVAPVAVAHRAAEPHQRRALVLRVPRPAGNQRLRQRLPLELRPAPELQPTGDVVELDERPRALASPRVDDLVAGIELVLLGRERERVDERLLARLRLLPVPLEPADRLRVLDQLRARLLLPLEERPPDRLRLAPVVLEQRAPRAAPSPRRARAAPRAAPPARRAPPRPRA